MTYMAEAMLRAAFQTGSVEMAKQVLVTSEKLADERYQRWAQKHAEKVARGRARKVVS